MTALATARPPMSIVIAGRRFAFVDPIRIYTCGVTPYDVTHLGHAATFVWVDTLVEILKLAGAKPMLCRNVTDVDDVLTIAAARVGAQHDRFAYRQQYDFDRDMAALRLRKPDLEPRARHHIDAVIAVAQGLLGIGAAYTSGGSVYVDGRPALARTHLSETDALRLNAEFGDHADDPEKRHPLDVAIWRHATSPATVWESPWGPGRPGWHAECTAMVLTSFGASVDIHAGGADLRFPHHAYESAIAEALTGVLPFARCWFHVGIVSIGGEKMAKSTGNLLLVDELLKEQSAAVVRTMILDRPWCDGWEYSAEELTRAESRLDDLRRAAGRATGLDEAAAEAVTHALLDDLDVSTAMDIAVEKGGDVASRLITTLRLD